MIGIVILTLNAVKGKDLFVPSTSTLLINVRTYKNAAKPLILDEFMKNPLRGGG